MHRLWRKGTTTSAVRILNRMIGNDAALQKRVAIELLSKTSVPHDEAVIAELKRRPGLAAEYLHAAVEDSDDPGVLHISLRHVVEAKGVAKVMRVSARRKGRTKGA